MTPSFSSRLGLGTVQFGLDYGITNTAGATALPEVSAILDLSKTSGITCLDTAHLYGSSEAVLGQALGKRDDFQIVTKTPDFSRLALGSPDEAAELLQKTFLQSLTLLGRDKVYGLLVHNAGGLFSDAGPAIYKELSKLKSSSRVSKIGASIYSPAELDRLLELYPVFDLVQIPLNLFDQRFIESGSLKKMTERGIEIHARSLFLQGALLAERDRLPNRLSGFADHFGLYHDALAENGLSPLEACLKFSAQTQDVTRFIIGVNTAAQLQDILATGNGLSPATLNFASLASNDTVLINPSLWPA